MEELIIALSNKDTNLTLLNVKVPKGSTRGPDSPEVIELREVISQLTKEVKSLTLQLLDTYRDHSANMVKLIQSPTSKSFSS